MTGDPIREAQARAAEFNAQARAAEFNAQARTTQRANNPERIALEELVTAAEEFAEVADRAELDWQHPGVVARLTLALNAARNALHMGRVLDEIAADPSIGHGHVGSVG